MQKMSGREFKNYAYEDWITPVLFLHQPKKTFKFFKPFAYNNFSPPGGRLSLIFIFRFYKFVLFLYLVSHILETGLIRYPFNVRKKCETKNGYPASNGWRDKMFNGHDTNDKYIVFKNGVFMGLCDAFVLLGKQELKQKVRIQI